MISFLFGIVFYFVVEKIKNKIVCRMLHTGVKCIKWRPEWHQEQTLITTLNDWIFL